MNNTYINININININNNTNINFSQFYEHISEAAVYGCLNVTKLFEKYLYF